MQQLPTATERIRFRAWRAADDDGDRALAEALWGDDRVAAFVGGPFDAAQVAARLDAELANQRALGIAYWPLVVGGVDVGCCGLKPREAPRVFELGFYLRADAWGRGLAVEAGRSVIAFAFDVLGAAKLVALHHPDNRGSQRALEKLGFRHTHHELYPPTGRMHVGYEIGASTGRLAP
jgi:[ribosomal protein S5]-alanine N-acetyltransferase